MSSISVNTITDASGGATTSINGFTPSVSNMAGRNRIINGGFDVWQRGTSHTYNNGDSGYHTADRWYSAAFVSGGTLTLSQQTANNVGVDSEFFLRATTTGSVAAGSATVYSEYKIENLKQFNNKNITLSFYIKANTNLSFQLRRHYYYGSGGSSEEYTSFSDVAVTTSWTRHTVTFPAQDFSAKTFGSSNYLGIMFYWSTDQGTNQLNDASIDIANVQLEEGSVATPFEHRQYGQELALCQRYYQIKYWYESASQATTIPLAPDMRSNPTVTFSNIGWGGTPNSVFGVGLQWIGVTGATPVWSAECRCSAEL